MLKRLLSLSIPLSILGLAVALNIANPPLLQSLRLNVFDTLLIAHPRPYEDMPVKIVDIDDESLKRLGQWPWPRVKVAEMIDRLTAAGAGAIALDIVFAEPDRTSPSQIIPVWKEQNILGDTALDSLPDHDAIFAESLANANAVTGFVLNEQLTQKKPALKAGYAIAGDDPSPYLERFTGSVISLPELEAAATGNGALNSIPERDGVIRRIPMLFGLGGKLYPTLSAEALRIAQGASTYVVKATGASGEASYGSDAGLVGIKIGQFEVPTDASGKFWVHYTDYTPKRYIPAWRVFKDNFDPATVDGQIILVGTSAAGLKDLRATPLNSAASGVEVHAQAIEQVLLQHFITRPDWMHGAELLSMIAVGLILIALIAYLPFIWSAAFAVAALGGAAWFSWWSFTANNMLVDPVTPSIAVLFVYLTESLRHFITTEREKQQVRDAFSHYMSPALVERLAEHPEALKLGGEMREMTILFCDIRGFTTISEQFDAEGLTRFINRFLTPMTDEILAREGTIDKYMGDCIMAFWNAPLDDDKHAEHGCLSALGMQRTLLDLNAALKQEAEEKNTRYIPVNIGIGLNTGECCVGNMGSDQRFDYSVLGDDVNLASRLEGQSKTYGVTTVIGDNTAKQLEGMAVLELDLIMVKGKTSAVRIHTLLGDKELAESDAFTKLKKAHDAMLKAYRAQEWDAAEKAGKTCRKHLGELEISGLYDLYDERIAAYKQTPPPADWDGVFVALTK